MGGLPDECIGVVPGAPAVKGVRAWIAALNQFKDQEIAEYVRQPSWRQEGDVWRRGGDVLIDYGTPGGCDSKSIAYHCPFDNGNPHCLAKKVEEALSNAGVKRVFSGHQPHGESPTVVRHPRTGLLVFTCDTSYSNMSALKLLNKANNRGDVVTMVRLDSQKVHLKGVLKENGANHECKVHSDPNADEIPSALVGRQLTDGSWVKTISNGNTISALGRGFQVFVRSMDPLKTRLLLKQEFKMQSFEVKLREMTQEHLRDISYAEQICINPEPVDADALIDTSRRQNLKNNVVDFAQEEFENADTYILDDRGTLTALSEGAGRGDPAKLQEMVVQRVNGLLKNKRVVFTTNDSNFSRARFLSALLQRGLNVCEKPEDAVHFLDTEVTRLSQQLELAQGTEKEECLRRQKQQAEARCEHFRVECRKAGGSPKATKEAKSRESALRNIITTAYTCAWYLKQINVKRPFVMCSDRGLLEELKANDIKDYVTTIDESTGEMKKEYAKDVTIENVTEILDGIGDIDAVVVGWDLTITAIKITVAAALLQLNRGASAKPLRLITCSSDKGGVLGVTPQERFPRSPHWNNRKLRHIGNGTMTSAVCACACVDEGIAVDVGRPSDVFIQLLRLPEQENGLNVDFSKAIMVGDTLATDIEMASRSGMRSLLVLSGVTTERDVQNEEDPSRFPTWILPSLARIRED